MVCAADLGLVVTPGTLSTNSPGKSKDETTRETLDPLKKEEEEEEEEEERDTRSRKISKKSIFHGLKRINCTSSRISPGGITKAKELQKNWVFHEHLYALPPSSSFIQELNRVSREARCGRGSLSKTRKTIVFNHFNVYGEKLRNLEINERKNYRLDNDKNGKEPRKWQYFPKEKLFSSSHDKSFSKNDRGRSTREERLPTERRGGKTVRGVEGISIKHDGPRSREQKRVPAGSRASEEKTLVVEKSNETVTEPTREDNRVGEKRGIDDIFQIREAVSITREGTKIFAQNVSKNDYEDSDIDESLLVDPSTDLPQLLIGTIDDENIRLRNPEFDVSRDLNFESDDEAFQRDVTLSSPGDGEITLGILKKSSGNVNFARNLRKKVRFEANSLPKRPRSVDKVANQVATGTALRVKEQSGSEKMSRVRRRRGSPADDDDDDKDDDGDSLGKGKAVALNGARESCGGKIAPDKADRGSGVKKKKKIESENGEKGTTLGRVTRLSMTRSLRENGETRRAIGTIVWGNCTGWWPGFIVDSEDVGMSPKAEKSWVCWIGEYRISHLRDKTQIQSFSRSFGERMIDTLGSKSFRDASYRACLETLELVNDWILRVERPAKPYDSWAKKHLVGLKNIDRLILHPYPPSVKLRLDELRVTNTRVTKRYLNELTTTTTTTSNVDKIVSSTRSSSSVKNTRRGDIFPVPGHLPLIEQKPGVIVWAKIMGQAWWPAVIVDYRDWGMREPSFGCQWIVWYGDATMSQVNHRFFLSFDNGVALMRDYAENSKRECYRRGVLSAAKDYCSRYGYRTEDWDLGDAFGWFERNAGEKGESSVDGVNSLPGIPGNFQISHKYPASIVDVLRNHRGSFTVSAAREHAIEESEDLRLAKDSEDKIDELCLMCLRSSRLEAPRDIEHPFFVGKLCEECAEKYVPTIFAYGDDGKCFFCTICAGSDTVVMCDEASCPRVYCTACVKYLVAPDSYDDIMLEDPWRCFVCDDTSRSDARRGTLKPRQDWKNRVARLFASSRDSVPSQADRLGSRKRERIRVLSLFDGISAGLVVLKNLKIPIDVYYASEIDPDAEMVSSANHGPDIVRLGDVRSITEENIRDIAPIDLLIGGSPCNDLSLVNPLRLGLRDPNGTGVLVFEYCRVKRLLERHNGGRHFFWLFENVASMPSEYRLEITRHLGRQPELIDSANYSPQHRPRLYWGNLPTVSFPLSSQDLQDVLTPNCNRHALVKKIRTVTTRVGSLKQGREALKPILMNDVNDTLWIPELEEIFGFPRHYTDVKNLCATKRQRLIAVSWSVQTITEIMRPLCNFFHTRNDEST